MAKRVGPAVEGLGHPYVLAVQLLVPLHAQTDVLECSWHGGTHDGCPLNRVASGRRDVMAHAS